MAGTLLEPLSPTDSYFDILGVPVGVDDASLTRRFRALSAQYHPDRWAGADAATQATALDASALVNDAYRTLRDPFSRAEYLLRRERGVKPDDTKGSAAQPPKALFAQVLELQEALMEFQDAQMEDDEDALARLRPSLAEARTEFQAEYDRLRDRLRGLFTDWDAGRDHGAILDGIAEVVGTRGYLRRVLSNLDKTLGPEDTAAAG